MYQSFNSWSAVKEAVSSGKDVMVDAAGKRHKVTYKVQDMTHFVVKIINDLDIIDSSGKITSSGIDALIKYLNSEEQFTYWIGELTPLFFDKKFIVYSVLADGQILGRAKQKIQFEIIERKNNAGEMAHPNVPASLQFIDAASFKSLSNLAPSIIDALTKTAQTAQLPDPTPDDTQAAQTPTKTEGTAETKKETGKKFLYTMRANSKLYSMEFTDTGSISAKTKDGSDPNGTVSYDATNKKVMWSTALDDAQSKESKISKVTNAPLFQDSEITNSQDKSFLEKMFTDADFRKKTIDEYEKEFAASEISAKTIKNLLYFKDGTSIFGQPASTSAEAEPAPDAVSAGEQKLIKGLADLKAKFSSQDQSTK